jgi:anti-sigma factor RsiW
MSEQRTAIPTCAEVVDRLEDWCEGRLPDDVEQPYETHLELCPPCAVIAREYQAISRVARGALDARMPEEAKERLRAAIASRLKGTH